MIRVLFVLLFMTEFAFGQFLNNPSFEGQPYASVSPPTWNGCDHFSTPDTQPGQWNVKTTPSDGNSYISLVTRGSIGDPDDNTKEDIYTQLTRLKIGTTYTVLIDLAFPPDVDDKVHPKPFKPIVLNAFFNFTYCTERLKVWESPLIDHIQWRTYGFHYTPQFEGPTDYFLLQADYRGSSPYYGVMLVDNLRIIEGEFEVPEEDEDDRGTLTYTRHCRLGVPNVFTPNDDGINDQFKAIHSSDVSAINLSVYNRWGKLVFETTDATAEWNGNVDGGEASAGIYYYHVSCTCTDYAGVVRTETIKGSLNLIR